MAHSYSELGKPIYHNKAMIHEGGKVKAMINFIFLGSRVTVDGDCSPEIKRCYLKDMTNLDSI